MQCKPKRKSGLHCFLFGSLKKLRFNDLGEEFCHSKSFEKFGILCVLRAFQSEFLGQKNRTNRKREDF